MTSEAIAEMLEAEPFRPFRVHTSSGRHYDVVNPALVVRMKNRLFIAMADLEHSAMVSHLHITSLETIENGHKKARRRGGRGKR